MESKSGRGNREIQMSSDLPGSSGPGSMAIVIERPETSDLARAAG